MKSLSFLIILFLISMNQGKTQDTIQANNANIEYTGRIDFADPLAPKFSYSGVSIRANFSGTSIAAILDDDLGQNYYNVIIDNEVINILHVTTGKKQYLLAEGLEDGIHEIELFKRTELTFGKTQFFGFVVDEGETLSPIINKRELLIEYIGNSITCGYGNEGILGQTFGPTTENHYLTYAAITSRNFMARHMAVSRSGIGVYRNYNGPSTGNEDCMSNLYTRTFLYDEQPEYNFADQPDLVCINLGTNDFSTSGVDTALYIENYLRLIDTIQSKYTMPEIVCLLGPMLSGSTLSDVRQCLTFIADSASKKGKGNVSFFEMSTQSGSVAIDYHPTVSQHKKNALELTSYIKSLMGWKIKPDIISAKVISAKKVQIGFNVPLRNSSDNYSGLTVSNQSGEIILASIAADTSDERLIDLYIDEHISPNDTLFFNYTPGTLESIDTVAIQKITNYPIINSLTETDIDQAFIDSEGKTITFNFNKNLKTNTDPSHISIYNKAGNISIDSAISSTSIIVYYISNAITKNDSVFASYSNTSISGTDDVLLPPFTDYYITNTSRVTSISSTNSKSTFFYPTPNHTGILNYTTNLPDNAKYLVYNINGKLITKGVLNSTQGEINLSDEISNGIYFFKIITPDRQFTQTVVFSNR